MIKFSAVAARLLCAGFVVVGLMTTNTTLAQVTTIIPVDPNSPFTSVQQFAHSVAIDGNTMVIGALRAGPVFDGMCFVYEHDGTDWVIQQAIAYPDNSSSFALAEFGKAVAIQGDIILIGAPTHTENSRTLGIVYVYAKTTNPIVPWKIRQRLRDPLSIEFPNGSSIARFGASVAIDGDYIIVGAPNQGLELSPQPSAADVGAAWVYQPIFDNTSFWELGNVQGSAKPGLLRGFDSKFRDKFGASIAMSGDQLLIGAPGASGGLPGEEVLNTGAVYVFELDDSVPTFKVFTELDKIINRTGATGDKFGTSVSVDGARAIIGSPGLDINGFTDAGMAQGFEKLIAEWVSDGFLLRSTYNNFTLAGTSVSIEGDTAVIGVPSSQPVPSKGEVWVHTRGTSNWNEVPAKVVTPPSTIGTGYQFGNAVALSSGKMVFGVGMNEVPGVAFAADLAWLNCAADFNNDGMIDGADLGTLFGNWGNPGATDLNNDGTTDGADMGILLGAWGMCP